MLTPWIWILLVGAAGGALNARVVHDRQLSPAWLSTRGRTRVAAIGLLGNLAVGALATGGVTWGTTGGTGLAPGDATGLLPAIVGLFIGFAAARCATSEADKVVLRDAVYKAAAAPAADPDTLVAIARSGPRAVLAIVDGLLPRRAGHQ